MKRDAVVTKLNGPDGGVTIRREAHGYPRIEGGTEADLYYGLGYSHGRDRQMQMWLLKLIGTGRASECLRADDALVGIDRYMRWIGLARDASAEVAGLSPESRTVLEAYCRGVNDGAVTTGRPFEFVLVGYRPEAWTPADALLLAKMMGFAGLAQSQGEAEKLILQMLQKGVDFPRLRALFPALTDQVAPDLMGWIRRVDPVRPTVPAWVAWRDLLPSFSASNNWAVGPERSASGKALLCGDPHLNLQLPCVWYPASMHSPDRYVMGATLPGVPVVAVGRSPDLAWSPTYGTADVSDCFLEEVKDGHYRRGEAWLPLSVREETVRPKGREAISDRVAETASGILEGPPDRDGVYLSFAWTGKQAGTACRSLDSMLRLCRARSAAEARDCFADTPFACFNWVFADREGNIGYQLGGLVPKRPPGASGLLPLRGWDPDQAWDGMEDPRRYPNALNPEEGFIVTANQDLNALGEVHPMTLPIAPYRAERLRDLLQSKRTFTPEDMAAIQYDRYSVQAERFMRVIEPLLPDTPNGQALRSWDCRYTADARGATLFERVYRELILEVFGDHGIGREGMAALLNETSFFVTFHGHFDRVLLSASSPWFGDRPREAFYNAAIARGLAGEAVPHGEAARIRVEHLFFGGRLPGFLGFDPPLTHIGSRATVAQAQTFKALGRSRALGPTFRMICDFAEDTLHVNCAGGASDRRWSPYYTSGLKEWERGAYWEMRNAEGEAGA